MGTLSLGVGLPYAQCWEPMLRFIHATPVSVAHTVFRRDVAIFVYVLPLLNLAVGFAVRIVAGVVAVSLVDYAVPIVIEEPELHESPTLDIVATRSFIRPEACWHPLGYLGAFLSLLGVPFPRPQRSTVLLA